MIAMSEVKLHREVSSEGAGLGLTSEQGVAAALAGSDAKKPIVLENVAVEAANAAILAAQPAATLSVVKYWTAQSIKDWTMLEMGSIINKEGITKDDIQEQCSSGSAHYSHIWADVQGKMYPPWSPSLSSSVAVLACREDPPVEDRHSSEARPRMLLSLKVELPTNDARQRLAHGMPHLHCLVAHV